MLNPVFMNNVVNQCIPKGIQTASYSTTKLIRNHSWISNGLKNVSQKAYKGVLSTNSIGNRMQVAQIHNRELIGNRDWVGYGLNGSAHYVDRSDFPMPAVRFKENTNELLALREKEKGDWRKLTIEEKKTLYRASFRQTFAEFQAPNGQWKAILGGGLILIAFAFWLTIIEIRYFSGPLPPSCSEKNLKELFRFMVDAKVNPITGLGSKWDYEKDDWKK